jgi:hypothetical protein
VGPEPETLAAEGSETFTVNPGAEIEITVELRPMVREGTGTLNYYFT